MTKKKLNLKNGIEHNGMFYFTLNIACMFFIIGMYFNFIAIQNNHGMMPIQLNYSYNDSKHFSFQNNSEVNDWYYTDIINLGEIPILNLDLGKCSIGDIFIMIGSYIIVYLFINVNLEICFKLWRKRHGE